MLKKFSNIQFSVLSLILLVLIVSAGMLLLFYYYVGSNHSFASYSEPWAQFGDFFGGILNPIISLVSMYLLYRIFRHESSSAETALSEEKNSHK